MNADGEIDDTDKKLLVDKIDSKEIYDENDKEIPGDLNLDGQVDLEDLNYFVQGYFKPGESKEAGATIETIVPASAIKSKADEKTKAEGLDYLSRGEGGAKLSTANGNPISKENPVTVEFEFEEGVYSDGIVIDSSEENPIETGDLRIEYTYKDESGKVVEADPVQVPLTQHDVHTLLTYEGVDVQKDEYGNIVINLGSQIAVKRVTFTITGTRKNNNLAEISRVEFVNGMENRIPEPPRDIPNLHEPVAGNKSFTVSWDLSVNVTGYEVKIKGPVGEEENLETVEVIVPVRGCFLSVSSLNEGKLVNKQEYEVSVQSVNGAWKSGYSQIRKVTPKVDKKPDAPDYVSVVGRYKAIDVSWKKTKDTDYFHVYYKEAGEDAFTKIEEKIEDSKYTIQDLKDKADYDIYVTGVNSEGESNPSKVYTASTQDPKPAQMPKYKLLNRADEGKVSEKIVSAKFGGGGMVDSPLDTEKDTAWGAVDNSPTSHYFMNTWDGGGYNPMGGRGLTFEFDKAYKMDRLALQEVTPQSQNYGYAQVRYWAVS